MKQTQELHDLGQSLWLDNITRLLPGNCSTAAHSKDAPMSCLCGLTSNPTIFDHAITDSNSYHGAICQLSGRELSEEELSFELALQDLTRAADLFATNLGAGRIRRDPRGCKQSRRSGPGSQSSRGR